MTKHRAGFMLMEVIVALTILGIGFSAVFAAISQASRNIEKLEGVQHRERLARNLFAGIELIELRAGDSASGTFEDGTRWRMEIQPFILPSPQDPAGVVRVEVRLEWDGNSGIQTKTIESYRRTQTRAVRAARSLEQQLDDLH